MNGTPNRLSRQFTHQCAVRCYHSHPDSFTGDREQRETSYQILPKSFALALIALPQDARRSSVIALLITPVNSLLRNILKGVVTTIHKHIVDTGNNETRGFEIVTRLVSHDNSHHQRNLLPPPRQMGVWCHRPFYLRSDFF